MHGAHKLRLSLVASDERPNGFVLSQDLKAELGQGNCPVVRSAADVACLFAYIAPLEREVMIAGSVDGQCRLMHWQVLAVGRHNRLVMRIGDAYQGAIRCCAGGVFIVHNHPSGGLTPSNEDIALTKSMAEAAFLLGYDFLDHVIVSRNGFRSLLDPSQPRNYARKLGIIDAVIDPALNGKSTASWRCLSCKVRNSYSAVATAAEDKQFHYLPTRCSQCGRFAWLKPRRKRRTPR
jgi:hypothetical protein